VSAPYAVFGRHACNRTALRSDNPVGDHPSKRSHSRPPNGLTQPAFASRRIPYPRVAISEGGNHVRV
jgi:hypothetical protein